MLDTAFKAQLKQIFAGLDAEGHSVNNIKLAN